MAKSKYDYVKEWRKNNPEKWAEQSRRYQKKYPEKMRATAMRWLNRNRDKARARGAENARKRRQSDPEGQRLRMAKFKAKKEKEREAIAGRPKPPVCELCGEFNLRVVFDHCHRTGKFRGWLCDRCNKALGIVKDQASLLRKMADYLDGKVNSGSEEENTNLEVCGSREVVSDPECFPRQERVS